MNMRLSTLKILLALVLISGGLLNSSGIMDRIGKQYIDATLNRALFSFAIARGLNAVLSVAQGTELSVEPMGLGLTLTPGEVLDPVNDLIERFSWIMLASSAALGMQEIFLEISAWPLMRWLITAQLMLTVITLFTPGSPKALANHLIKASIILLFLRFCIPCIFIVNELTYQQFLSSRYQQSTLSIEQANTELKELTSAFDADATKSASEAMPKSFLEAFADSINVKAAIEKEVSKMQVKIQKFQQIATDTTDYILDLIVIFTLQTVLFPLLFLFAFYKAAAFLAKINFL